MTSVTGAVVGCYFVTVIYEAFRRWEVNGLGDVRPPSGTGNFVLAVVLILTLVLRPNGITGGREIPWPGDWSLDSLRRLGRKDRSQGGDSVAAESAK
jgi:branched-chain amino acid transport system permease protein